ncbi:aldose epimerase [Aquimarina sp. I32.4]|uniref:aldose epimerase family protein n=1 Tax=Aquimarina sp. I32.4 TaxID=2053903 RepID=UPI000CDE87F4|nr:aldose epimerase [Aquimarina sp. I32.4]
MSDKIRLHTIDEKNNVIIDRGELVSFTVDSIEIMHQKGDPGWGNTEIEMFPIIGATKDNEFSIQTPKGNAKLDQHGILRAIEYSLKEKSDNKASFYKKYKANTLISNPKFPKKSMQQWLDWPYDFEFIKTFELSEKGLKITFEIRCEEDMPLMLGFHPAFKVYNQEAILVTNKKEIVITDILEAGASAYLLDKCKEITLKNNGDIRLTITTNGFRHIMLWTEVTNMICIEPITFYPSSVVASELYTGFDSASDYDKFEVIISPS